MIQTQEKSQRQIIKDDPNRYVVGFLFHEDLVALILKNRPEWQKGLLNGVGGHIKNGETPEQAMEREFLEEAGCRVDYWRKFALLTNEDRSVELHLFTADLNGDSECVKTMTDEHIWWFYESKIPQNIIPNLKWLIPMAHHENHFMAEIVFAQNMW